ncbi:RimJ/RimL family protein N-acetyltransferase [Nocardioides sp. BE266]|uniref:GNAT family N-acetyltransferase n=1 Tax=Nocardioides sp. BE266 TaxID=2817725 RepID=UPI00285D4901|nr:GNAT family N-acetyltransferase [Nocardioides sp. BE266]MDR7252943.1 RimJ/RimL family protein N-acetyltransferase [Nocardioides sp. BE266]
MGDDSLTEVRRRYVAVNGDHPMSDADDAYVREHFVEATPEALALMVDGRLPLPSYLLSDGTPMVPAEHGRLAEFAGGVDALHDWFIAFWPDDPGTGEAEWGHYLSGQYVCLKEVSPIRIRMKTARVAEASAAVEILRRDPHDPIGRGMIGQAVDGVLAVPGLDSILLPMTAYDRLRFGGPTVRETWVEGPRREFLTPVAPVWPLVTERLLLRPWRAEDEAALVEAWADEDYASLLLTGTQNPAEVREMVRRRSDPGDGMIVGLVAEHDGEVVGDSVLILGGTGLSEAEIGWTVMPRHAGRGYATEAARAVLRMAFEHYGLRRVTANLDARNDRSAAMCERLGMRRETHRLGDFWSKGRWTDSYEYALLRDEWLAQQP